MTGTRQSGESLGDPSSSQDSGGHRDDEGGPEKHLGWNKPGHFLQGQLHIPTSVATTPTQAPKDRSAPNGMESDRGLFQAGRASAEVSPLVSLGMMSGAREQSTEISFHTRGQGHTQWPTRRRERNREALSPRWEPAVQRRSGPG